MRWLAKLRCYFTGHALMWETWAAIDVDAQYYVLGCTDCRRYWETVSFTNSLLESTPQSALHALRYGVLTACEVAAQKRWWKR